MIYSLSSASLYFLSLIGLPSEGQWPNDVTISRENFSAQNPEPITDHIPELTNEAADLLMVRIYISQ